MVLALYSQPASPLILAPVWPLMGLCRVAGPYIGICVYVCCVLAPRGVSVYATGADPRVTDATVVCCLRCAALPGTRPSCRPCPVLLCPALSCPAQAVCLPCPAPPRYETKLSGGEKLVGSMQLNTTDLAKAPKYGFALDLF